MFCLFFLFCFTLFYFKKLNKNVSFHFLTFLKYLFLYSSIYWAAPGGILTSSSVQDWINRERFAAFPLVSGPTINELASVTKFIAILAVYPDKLSNSSSLDSKWVHFLAFLVLFIVIYFSCFLFSYLLVFMDFVCFLFLYDWF